MGRALKASVDVYALQTNAARVRRLSPGTSILAMVKANGYGHGLLSIGMALQEVVEGFGVACIEEAVELRLAGIQKPIFLMEGFFHPSELPEIAQLKLTPVLHHAEQIAILKRYKASHPLTVWIKIDTGMHRLGFPLDSIIETAEEIRHMTQVHIGGFMTHFAKADCLDDPMTKMQIKRFFEVKSRLPGMSSLANSAAVLRWPDSHGDWVRPGLMLYGVSPFPNRIGSQDGLKPAMTLQTEIISVQTVKKGSTIGYGAMFTCSEDMPVGIVAVGYGDGYPWHTPPGTPVLIGGHRVPIIGRVSMDMLSVDLRGVPACIGDPVILWGPELPIEEVAAHIGTLPYTLLTGLSTRVPVEIIRSSFEERVVLSVV